MKEEEEEEQEEEVERRDKESDRWIDGFSIPISETSPSLLRLFVRSFARSSVGLTISMRFSIEEKEPSSFYYYPSSPFRKRLTE